MQFQELSLGGAYLIHLEKHGDDRGFFARFFCQQELGDLGLATEVVQVNDSFSARTGTLRGLHYQLGPHAETKVVRCIRGAIWDCILDVRPASPTFGQWFGAELTAENRTMMYAPKGFAHGFISLTDNTEVLYLTDAAFASHAERGVRWNDPQFDIAWPLQPRVVSEKDSTHPDFDQSSQVTTNSEGGLDR